jgi:hypothetical protein
MPTQTRKLLHDRPDKRLAEMMRHDDAYQNPFPASDQHVFRGLK